MNVFFTPDQRRLAARRELGLCARCESAAEPGRGHCRLHLDAANARVKLTESYRAKPRRIPPERHRGTGRPRAK